MIFASVKLFFTFTISIRDDTMKLGSKGTNPISLAKKGFGTCECFRIAGVASATERFVISFNSYCSKSKTMIPKGLL